MPFAIALFWYSYRFLKTGENKYFLLMILFTLFNVMIKPSFLFAFIIAFPLFSMSYYTMVRTSTPEFCASCHEIKPAVVAWRSSTHTNNAAGVVVDCMDCHLPAPEDTFDFLEDNRSNVKAVIHMGAISSTTETDVDLIIDTNFRLSLELWKWCTAHQTRLIYASSAATYGGGEQGFDDDASPEALAKLHPLNAYGWSKHLFDRRVQRIVSDSDARPPQWAGLKFFNVTVPTNITRAP